MAQNNIEQGIEFSFNHTQIDDLRLRVRLIDKLVKYIQQENFTIPEAAKKFACSEIIINNLLYRKVWLFDSELLIRLIQHCK